jgi:hypothetical protein
MNLKSMYACCAAMLLALLSGCASMKEGGAAFSEAKAEAGKALVYVYRQDAVDGNFVPNVWIVGARSFDLPNRRYAAVSVPPGKHVVKATWAKRSDLPDAETSISVEPNQTYYVQVTSETHDGAVGKAVVFYMTAKTSVRVVQRDEAMKSLPQTKSAL